ncbi:MAG TPA: L-seryl-tRNA(Sec) selenium transferase [Prolixibacteraceae bacterium]|jgi:L-seryl-tRNA(Ser) seleniumtransferase
MSLRNLPSIDRLLQASGELISNFGRPLTVKAFRQVLDEIRMGAIDGIAIPSIDQILNKAEVYLIDWTKPSIQPVINATGVILHTNLGRAPLSQATILAMAEISNGYSNLEFNLESGKRGDRLGQVEALLHNLTGAEAGLVVNNCASAVLLVLSALVKRKYVIIPRSQLIEIGGGFRMPDVMKESGVRLLEIGTTNKVRISDYEDAAKSILPDSSAVVMHAHRSNFKIIGFTEEPELKSTVDAAHRLGMMFIDDLGSGALIDTARFGMQHEPTVQESLAAGSDVIMFSGDKLIGGPQAGIIIGKKELIEKIKKHPLARALRADKTCIAGLSATLTHYLRDEAERDVPIWRMISMPALVVKKRAEAWKQELGCGEVFLSESTVGGGSLPGESFPSWVFSIPVKSPDKVLANLRKNFIPVIARTQDDRVILDPRTVMPEEEPKLLACLRTIFPAPQKKVPLKAGNTNQTLE